DIETVASEEGKNLISSMPISAPSNYKDEKKIKEYCDAKRHELIDKAALTWWTGKIVCVTCVDFISDETHTFYGDDEKKVLVDFFNVLTINYPVHKLVGKNSDDFDLPWLRARAMRHGIGLPHHLRLKYDLSDIQKIFGHSRSSSQVPSLKNMAYGLALPMEKLANGSDVATMYEEGKWDEIGEYCLMDSKIVREVYLRYDNRFEPTISQSIKPEFQVPF